MRPPRSMAAMVQEQTPARRRTDPRLLTLEQDSGYRIHGRIGSGGMGIVYRAQDADGRDVAIKLLRHEIADDPRARDRLAREVAAQSKVRSDSIVRIVDAELESPDAFVVTEYVPGPTLDEAVRTVGALHPEVVREIAAVLGEALQRIHDSGVVHRDLKPSNILLRGARLEDLTGFDPDGDRLDPVIIDFGIAIAAEESRLTSTGLVMGTAAYLDPEVVRTNHTGAAGDWWALAALLAFAATGREPFGSGRADIVFLRAERGDLDVDGLPTQLAAWLRAALQAEPSKRPEPRAWMTQLATLDLEEYDDPGPTDVLPAADGRDTGRLAASDTAGVEGATEVIPRVDDSTQALPVVPTPNEPSPADPPTELLDAVRDPTMPLPVVRDAPPLQNPPQAPQMPREGRGDVQQRPYAPTSFPPQRPVQRPPQAPPLTPQQHPYAPARPGLPMPAGMVGPMPPHGAWPTPMPPPPRRPFLIWMGHVLLIALGAVAPYIALTLVLLLGALARTWERSHRSIAQHRLRGDTGAGPLWTSGMAAPFRFLLGLLETVGQAIIPLMLGLLIGIAVDAGWTLWSGSPPADGVAFAIAVGVTVLVTWVGLGSATTRRGAHRMVDAAAPDRIWGLVVGVLLALLIGAVVATILARDGMVDYFPFSALPRLEDIAFWRR